MGDLGNIGEFGLIERIKSAFDSEDTSFRNNLKGVLGIGDDCAVLPQKSGLDTLVSTDMLVEGTHFLIDRISAWQLGWKSAAVNVSDIAAMGGRPSATFLSLAIPDNADQAWISAFIEGYKTLSARFGIPLLGGDTTASPDRLCINVTVLGTIESGRARLRSQACTGDVLCVTGALGDSSAGLKAVIEQLPPDEITAGLVKRHYEPLPRVGEGIALAGYGGVHAMMDISDGIGSDLRHMLKASSVGAEVDIASIPVSDALESFCRKNGFDPLDFAISGGEDYELLFTVTPETEKTLAVPHTLIGRIVEDPSESVVWKGSDRDFIGFRHF